MRSAGGALAVAIATLLVFCNAAPSQEQAVDSNLNFAESHDANGHRTSLLDTLGSGNLVRRVRDVHGDLDFSRSGLDGVMRRSFDAVERANLQRSGQENDYEKLDLSDVVVNGKPLGLTVYLKNRRLFDDLHAANIPADGRRVNLNLFVRRRNSVGVGRSGAAQGLEVFVQKRNTPNNGLRSGLDELLQKGNFEKLDLSNVLVGGLALPSDLNVYLQKGSFDELDPTDVPAEGENYEVELVLQRRRSNDFSATNNYGLRSGVSGLDVYVAHRRNFDEIDATNIPKGSRSGRNPANLPRRNLDEIDATNIPIGSRSGRNPVNLPRRNLDEIDATNIPIGSRSGRNPFNLPRRNFDEIDATNIPIGGKSGRNLVNLPRRNFDEIDATYNPIGGRSGRNPLNLPRRNFDEIYATNIPIGSRSGRNNMPRRQLDEKTTPEFALGLLTRYNANTKKDNSEEIDRDANNIGRSGSFDSNNNSDYQ